MALFLGPDYNSTKNWTLHGPTTNISWIQGEPYYPCDWAKSSSDRKSDCQSIVGHPRADCFKADVAGAEPRAPYCMCDPVRQSLAGPIHYEAHGIRTLTSFIACLLASSRSVAWLPAGLQAGHR